MTVDALGKTMSTRELGRWRAYARQRGLPSVRLQYQLALLALVLARVHGNEGQTLADFVLDFDTDRKQATRDAAAVRKADEGAAVLAGLAGAGVYRLGQRKAKG